MKWALLFLLSVHGLIHLLGFARGFNLAAVSGTGGTAAVSASKTFSTLAGGFWLFTCAAFLAAAVSFLMHKPWWWMPASGAIVLSQILIVFYWQEARWGTVANLLLLLPVVAAFAERHYAKTIDKEVEALLLKPAPTGKIITNEMLAPLPAPVQKWMEASGVVGKETATVVRLKQKGLMRLKPGRKDWIETAAEQCFRWDEPAFLWRVNMKMMPLLPVAGRDKFENGRGAMTIKAFSLVNMVNAEGNQKLNQSAAQRLLAEICWMPSAALSPYVHWQPVDDSTAKATLSYGGTTGEVTFFFTSAGDLRACRAHRYKDTGAAAKPLPWEVRCKRYAVMNGVRIPVEAEATWKLKEGDFTWYKLTVTDVAFNKAERRPNVE